MTHAFETQQLTKRFGQTTALDRVTMAVPPGSIVGLVGRNGSGKTTLLNHVTGLALPTGGTCLTLGVPADRLGPDQLSRLGVVHQNARLLEWMRVGQHIRYVASFYARWDRGRQERLVRALDLDVEAIVATLSPGNMQKLAVILAVGHHPDLLLLDEPTTGLDPIARETLLELLLDIAREDDATIVVSSHQLHDLERVMDWVVCLEKGVLVTNGSLDELKDVFGEWIVTAVDGQILERFAESFIVKQELLGQRARLTVRDASMQADTFAVQHHVSVETRPLNLESIFPLLINGAQS